MRATIRIWRLDGERWSVAAGSLATVGAEQAPLAPSAGEGAAFVAIPGAGGLWLEVEPDSDDPATELLPRVMAVVTDLMHTDAAIESLTSELASRYEEIDLIYTIGELLGRSHAVEEVASQILTEVASVLGAKRAGIRVLDEAAGLLRLVAIVGSETEGSPKEVSIDAPDDVVVVRAARTRRVQTGPQPDWVPGEVLAVPIIHAASGGPTRVVGTLALAERAGGGTFTREEVKLLTAVATQVGAALENTRLAAEAIAQHDIERELHLAHDLQQKLLPRPAVLRGEADVAVASIPAESLGGDFYTFARFGRGRVGVMLGDVATHGFSAALIAAQAMAAAGIYANASVAPDETLGLIRDSLAEDLENTEMYLTVFYAILEPGLGRLVYSNAGHPYAWQLPHSGPAVRLAPTDPPLGLVENAPFERAAVPWGFGRDLLVLATDGVTDLCNGAGERFGEARLLARLEADRDLAPAELKLRILADLNEFGGKPHDDTTLLLLKM